MMQVYKSRRRADTLRWFIYLIAIVCAGIIGVIIAGFSYFGSGANRRNAAMSLEFIFDGANKHKTPNGMDFSVEDIRSESILNMALSSCGLSNLYSAEQIADALQVQGSYPRNVVNKITGYRSMLDFSDTQSIMLNQYFPTYYTVRLYDDFDSHISDKDLTRLCKAIVDVYHQNFMNTCLSVIPDVSLYIGSDVRDYDYPQQVQAYQNTLIILESFANKMSIAAPNFLCRGIGFNDIYQKLNLLRTSGLYNVSSIINYDSIVKSSFRLRTQYEYEISILENKIQSAQTNLVEFDSLIELYQTGDVVYINNGSNVSQIDNNSRETYEMLQTKKQELIDDISQYNSDLKNYKELLKNLSADAVSDNASKQDVENKLAAIGVTIQESIEELRQIIEAYNSTVITSDDIAVNELKLQKSRVFSLSFAVEIVKSAAPLCILVMIVCCIIEIKEQKQRVMKRSRAVSDR